MESDRAKSQISIKSNQSRVSKNKKEKSRLTFENTDNDLESENEYTDNEEINENDEQQQNGERNQSRATQNVSLSNDSLALAESPVRNSSTKSARSKQSLRNDLTDSTFTGSSCPANEANSLRSFKTQEKETFYAISALKFSLFEGMLFDLIGIPNTNVFKPMECLKDTKIPDTKKIENFSNTSNVFISDMNILNERLETNVFHQSQLKTVEPIIKKSSKSSSKSAHSIRSNKEDEPTNIQPASSKPSSKTKAITVIHHSKTGERPRKALRMLISKKNMINIDLVLNEMCNLLRLEYAHVRRIFSLSGNKVIFRKIFFLNSHSF